MIYLATDHAGFALKEKVKKYLQDLGYGVEDFGAYRLDPDDDYPDFISKAAEKVSKDPENSKAIILGGSGQGEAIVANKFPNVRTAVYYGPPAGGSEEMPKLTREHNDSNILSLGARFLSVEKACAAVKLFLDTPFSGDPRHTRRIEKIKKLEQK